MARIPDTELENIKRLYYMQKMHMAKIAEHYNVSIDSIVYFMRKKNLTRRNLSEINILNYERKPLSYKRIIAMTDYEKNLELSGVMLYRAEGHKSESAGSVDFANSDPVMVRTFLNFLRIIFRVDEKKIRIYLYCHKGQNVDELVKFWSNICYIDKSQFTKPYVRKGQIGDNQREMKHGMVHIRYSDKRLLSEIMKMIHFYSLQFANLNAPIV